jgi:predicted RNA binding protein YcfA (HicA-like mRNA interferase family)
MAAFGRRSSKIYCVVRKSGARTYPVLFWSFSTKQIVAICKALGLQVRPDRGKGSHLRVYKADGTAVTTLPGGRSDLARGTARSILRDLKLSPQQAMELVAS